MRGHVRNERRGLIYMLPPQRFQRRNQPQVCDSIEALPAACGFVFAFEVLEKESALLFDTRVVSHYEFQRIEKSFTQLLC